MAVLAHKIRLAPTLKQEQALMRACGVARFTWNWALSRWGELRQQGVKPSTSMLKKEWNSIKREQFPWVYDSPKNASEASFWDLQTAWTNFWGGKANVPVFKKKGVHNSFYTLFWLRFSKA